MCYSSPVFAKLQSRRAPLFSFIGEVSAQSGSPSPAPVAVHIRPSRHTRARDEKQLPLSSSKTRLYKSLSHRDAHKSFRIRSYENCRVSPAIFPSNFQPQTSSSCLCHTSENSPISDHPDRIRVPSDHRESRDLTCTLSPLAATLAENHLLSPIIATDPKTHVSNPFICHTSETARGVSYSENPMLDLLLVNSAQRLHLYPPFPLCVLCVLCDLCVKSFFLFFRFCRKPRSTGHGTPLTAIAGIPVLSFRRDLRRMTYD